MENKVLVETSARHIHLTAEAVEALYGKGAELSIANATSGMTAPFHSGAARYFAEQGFTVPTA